MQDEQKSLRAVNSQLQKDLEEQGKRLSAAETDKDRFRQEASYAHEQVCVCACACVKHVYCCTTQVREKEAHIQQLSVHLSQAQADRQVS